MERESDLQLITTFPNPIFTKATEDTGIGVCTDEIEGMTQSFIYGFESYIGSSKVMQTGCFPHEVECLNGIAKALLMCWDTPFDFTEFSMQK